jgi:glycosyltransferase involved in cell wall biosynthesis
MNEASNIKSIYQAIKDELDDNLEYEILFVCDPSTDSSEAVIKEIANSDKSVKGIFLADRAGQTESIRAGYECASGDAVISMDADFQDPPELLQDMIKSWRSGSLIVHTKRVDRASDTFMYRTLTKIGYKFLSWLTYGKIQSNVGDFRLIDKAILPLVLKYQDPNPFWRGITSLAGVKSDTLPYRRPTRRSGTTKYNLRIGSPSVALRGIVAFSNKPLILIQTVGFFSVFIGLFTLITIILAQIIVPGYSRGIPTIIALLSIFFSIQFASTAIIATYLSVLIEQTRRRPNYIIRPKTDT